MQADPLPAELPGKPRHLIYLPPTLPISGVSAPCRLNPSLCSLYPFSLHVLQDITMCLPQFLQKRNKKPKVSFNSTSSTTFFFSSQSSPGYTSPVCQDVITSSAKDTSTPLLDFPGGSDGKASVYNAGDLGLFPGLGRFPGEGNGNPLQYSCLENPMNGGAWCRLLSMGLLRVRHD